MALEQTSKHMMLLSSHATRYTTRLQEHCMQSLQIASGRHHMQLITQQVFASTLHAFTAHCLWAKYSL